MAFFLGLDLGQAQDYSALVVLERVQDEPFTGVPGSPQPKARYELRHAQRWPLQTPYPTIVVDLMRLCAHDAIRPHQHTVVLDYTGCGRPVWEMFRQRGFWPRAVYIHGGQHVSSDHGSVGVPKRDLVSTVQVLLQQDRLKFAADVPELPALINELRTFRQRIDPQTAHDSYSHWREQDHDDLVLALALAAWWGEQRAHQVGYSVPYSV